LNREPEESDMTKSRIIQVLCVALVLVTAAHVTAQQQPSRLVVNNQTRETVELFTLVEKQWQSRGRINPGASSAVYNVTNGQQFRARWGSGSKDHFVKLGFDRGYGGWQDVFNVP
jgi:hypothetical protein